MASRRSFFTLLCVCSILLVLVAADVAVAADVNQQQPPATGSTGSTEKFYLRGNVAGVSADGEAGGTEFEHFQRRELSDYGTNPANHNCRTVNCRKM